MQIESAEKQYKFFIQQIADTKKMFKKIGSAECHLNDDVIIGK